MQMDGLHVSRLLGQGIAAAKANQRHQAREYLISTYAVRSGGPSPQRLRGLGVTSDRLELETALDVTLRF